jgi:hypothetical protein
LVGAEDYSALRASPWFDPNGNIEAELPWDNFF